MKPIKLVTKVLPWVIILAVVYFFANTLAANFHKLDGVHLTIDGKMIAGIILLTLAVAMSGTLWAGLLSVLSGQKIRGIDGVRIHSASWLLKYVPGQVGSLLNKLAWGTKQGISKKTVTTSFLYENILTVFASIILSTPIILMFKDQLGGNLSLLVPLVIIIPMLIILYKPLFYGLLNKLFALLKKAPFKDSDFLSTKALVIFQLKYLIPRILNGVGFVLIASSLLVVEPHMYIGLGATFILASVVGLLAFFVPGGLGVREAVIVLLVSTYFPLEQAILLSVVTRLYSTVADIGVALVYIILNKGRIKQL